MAPASDIKQLEVYTVSRHDEAGVFHGVANETILLKCVASIASLALDLIASDCGTWALQKVAEEVVRIKKKEPGHDYLRGWSQAQVKKMVCVYIGIIRKAFPHIIVTDQYGMYDLVSRTNKTTHRGSFHPGQAVLIEINEFLVHSLVINYEADSRSFVTLLLRLAIAVAHELVHGLILFLLKDREAHTPPAVTYGPYGNDKDGQAGRFWEFKMFGGCIEMGVEKDGHEHLVVCPNGYHCCYVMTYKMVEGLVGRNFNRYLIPGHPITNHTDWGEGIVASKHPRPAKVKGQDVELSREQVKKIVRGNLRNPAKSWDFDGGNLLGFSTCYEMPKWLSDQKFALNSE